jgi:hypothetical protein
VSGRRRPVSAPEQHQPVIQPIQQLINAQRFHPGRGQLDRQRHPIQPLHELRHHRPGLPGQGEMWINAAGPLGEQRYCLGLANAREIIGIQRDQGRQSISCLPGRPNRLAAGGQDAHVVCGH